MHWLLKPIRYVFYRILAWKLRDSRESTPVLVAGLATTLLIVLNCTLVMMCAYGLRGGGPLLPTGHFGPLHYLVAAAVFFASSSLMNSVWVANEKFAKVQHEFAGGTQRRQLVRTVLFWACVVASPVLPLVFAILWHAAHT
jgi:hypothetical protein